MTLLVYDATYEGFFTAIFEVYEYKFADAAITRKEKPAGSLFGELHIVTTDEMKCNRVYGKLKEKLSKNGLKQLYDTWLSELDEVDDVLLRFIRYVFNSQLAVENDFSNPDVLFVQQTSRKVHREKHRMEAFVRFQLTKDELYYAIIQPDFNVLPLIARHFKNRYADQRWLIYDTRRKYGLYYDLNEVEEVQMEFATDLNNSDDLKLLYDDKEELYQQLWKQYFISVNIKARRNMKLHIQHMPKRYWKHLIEKK